MILLATVGVPFALGGGACGGNVVVDAATGVTSGNAGGSGGHGGSIEMGGGGQGGVTSSSSPVGTTPSTGTATAALCNDFCTNVGICLSLGSCTDFCAAAIACVQNAGPNNCCAIQQCDFGPASTGAAASATGSSGFGGTSCTECVAAATHGACQATLDACNADPACAAIQTCHAEFGYQPACIQSCDDRNPAGQMLFDTLTECTVCDACTGPCAGLPVTTEYCASDGG